MREIKLFTMKRYILLTVIGLLSLMQAGAQEVPTFLSLSGRVLDGSSGAPLHYASIDLAGTNISNVSNAEGDFTLKVDARTLPGALVMDISPSKPSTRS